MTERMSYADALMWNIERDPALRSTITSVFVFDREIEREVILRRFERLTHVFPKARQRVRSNPLSVAPPRWEVDPHFDLHFHVWWVKAPGKGTMEDLLRLAEPIAMSGFDRARPLWRAVVVEGLEHGKSALIMKIHHAVTDGVGGIQVQLELLDFEPDAPERSMPPAPEVKVLNQAERWLDASLYEVRRQLDIARRMGQLASASTALVTRPSDTAKAVGDMASSIARTVRPVSGRLSPLFRGSSLSARFDTVTVPLDRAKAAAKVAGGKLNDAFVAGLLLGLAEYHRRHGIEGPVSLRMAMPINVRTGPAEGLGGNAFVPARIELTVETDDPVEVMREVHDRVDFARGEPANSVVNEVSGVLNRLPSSMVTAVFGSMVKSIDFTASNVPGAPFPVYMAGAKMLTQFPFGPLAGAALNITLLSYENALNIGVNSDPAAVPDPEVLTECLELGFERVLAAAPDVKKAPARASKPRKKTTSRSRTATAAPVATETTAASAD